MEQMTQNDVQLRDGASLTIEVHGEPDGPTLAIVPGAMSDARAWRQVAQAVTAWPTVAVINRRGRAPSSALPADYSLREEMEDAAEALEHFSEVGAVFGWSYGGLIALSLATSRPLPHVIAYDPIMRGFASEQLPALAAADAAEDRDRTVEIVCGQISGMSPEQIAALRADEAGWETMRRLSTAVLAETAAINEAEIPEQFASLADRVDLIVGGMHRGLPPYGTSFDDVRVRTPQAAVHELTGHGHMAHLEDPEGLADVVDSLAAR